MIVIRRQHVGRPLTVPLRDEIASMVRAGVSRRAVAAKLGVCKRTVDKYHKAKISAQV